MGPPLTHGLRTRPEGLRRASGNYARFQVSLREVKDGSWSSKALESHPSQVPKVTPKPLKALGSDPSKHMVFMGWEPR